MGKYYNPEDLAFKEVLDKDIYVDKSLLIDYTNKVINTQQSYLCISRPIGFGKTTDANMLVAYYSKGCKSQDLFDTLKISKADTYLKFLNRCNVIYINVRDFLIHSKSISEMISNIQNKILEELKINYQEYCFDSIVKTLYKIFDYTEEQFVFIIDDWDYVLRIYDDYNSQYQYIDFLRYLLKDKPYVALAYMTGILPIKKFGTQGGLNMFDEISMIHAWKYSSFMGFTEDEVQFLCDKYNMRICDMKEWYGGYYMDEPLTIYHPKSLISTLITNELKCYRVEDEGYQLVKNYINRNMYELKDTIISMLNGKDEAVNVLSFANDMTTFNCKDDVLTLLIHLGCLCYNQKTNKVSIPNKEMVELFVQCINMN